LEFEEQKTRGIVYSHARVWHPVHPSLRDRVPYLVVLVELYHADGVRLLGNLLGDPYQEVSIGRPVVGVFEHHTDADPPFSLLQWTWEDEKSAS
jgi:uncharacterized OB-fold protein